MYLISIPIPYSIPLKQMAILSLCPFECLQSEADASNVEIKSASSTPFHQNNASPGGSRARNLPANEDDSDDDRIIRSRQKSKNKSIIVSSDEEEDAVLMSRGRNY